MKLTIAAQEMLNALAEVTSDDDLATVEYLATAISLAEQTTRAPAHCRIATWHIKAAMAELIADTDPMESDYEALAAEEPTSQNGDSRDAAEVAA